MDVRCEKCGTEYDLDESRVGPHGSTVKCTACGFVFKVRRAGDLSPTPPPRSPQGREWLVRKPDGQMIAFRELTTLQKWIVEGRIQRDDEISKNGETWKRLGNIMELEAFFSVYEKANQLNVLIDQGHLSLPPLQLRGSEVLSAANPVVGLGTSRLAEGLSIVPPLASSSPSGAIVSRKTVPSAAPTPASNDLPPLRNISADLEPMNLERAGNGAHAHPPGAIVAPSVEKAKAIEAEVMPPNVLPGPAALDAEEAREKTPWVRKPNQPPEPSKSDIVVAFRRGRQRRMIVWASLLAVVAAAGGGAAFAVYGPEGTWLKEMVANNNVLPSNLKPKDDAAGPLVDRARREADFDSLEHLELADRLLSEAQAMRTSDARIIADRALVLTRHADVFRWWAHDLEEDAAQMETSLAQAAKIKKGAAAPPADPSLQSRLTAQRELATAKRGEASQLLRDAFELARQAHKFQPQAPETARALAAYYQVQRDYAAFEREIGRVRASLEAGGTIDAAVLYIEAASLFDRAGEDLAQLEKAAGLLAQAITTRPTLNRARILLARIHLRKGDLASAKSAVDQVLLTAQTHEEALRLRKRILDSQQDGTSAGEDKLQSSAESERTKLEEAAEKSVEKTFEEWITLADKLRERDHTRKAKDAYEKAATLRPGSAEPLSGLGWCYLDLEQSAAALSAFSRAIKANVRYADAYYGLAEAHRALGNQEEAVRAYEHFLKLAPSGASDRRAAEHQLRLLRKGGEGG